MKTLLSIVLLFMAGQGAPEKLATVEGIVVKASDGRPVPNAAVELSKVSGTSANAITAAVTSEGRFILKDVQPGEYRLASTSIGYVRSEYGQRGSNGRGLTIKIAAGQEFKDLRIALTETGAIYGRIFDRTGATLANVSVQALKYGYQNGKRTLSTVKAVVTNDLGEYRLFWLPPGLYYLSATPLPGSMPEVIARPIAGGVSMSTMSAASGALITLPDDEGTIPFYFPGTTDPKNAQSIELRPSENRGGVDIRIQALKTHRVRGKILNLPPSDPSQPLFPRIQVTPRDPTTISVSDSSLTGATVDAATGVFEIRGVLPGLYYVNASVNFPRPPGSPASIPLAGRVPVEVWDADVEGLTIPVEAGVSVPVQVSIEGQAPDSSDMKRLRVTLTPGAVATYLTQQPGVFTLLGVSPNDYRLNVTPLPENGFMKSARAANIDVLNDGISIGGSAAGPPQIQLVIGVNGGIVEGIVTNDKREPLSNVTVAIVPESTKGQRSDLYKSVATDALGQFKVSGLAPGEYKAFAWEDVENGAWQDPAFLQLYEDRGKALRIAEGGRENIPLIAIGPQR